MEIRDMSCEIKKNVGSWLLYLGQAPHVHSLSRTFTVYIRTYNILEIRNCLRACKVPCYA